MMVGCLFNTKAFILGIWFVAAQKARDDFDEAERALREVDDQIKWVAVLDVVELLSQ